MKPLINILIVDDEDEKIRVIESQINNAIPFCDPITVIAKSIRDAHEAMSLHSFDLIVLDLKLPTRPGGNKENNGGELLLEAIQTQPCPPIYVLGLTAFEECERLNAGGFESLGHGIMTFYFDARGAWSSALFSAIKRCSVILSSKLTRRHKCDFIVVCATDAEYDGLTRSFGAGANLNSVPDVIKMTSNRMSIARIDQWTGLLIKARSMGPASAAALSARLLSLVDTEIFIMAGICGGFSSKTKIGDAVIIESAFAWNSGKIIDAADGSSHLPEIDSHRSSAEFSGMCVSANNPAQIAAIALEFQGKRPEQQISLRHGSIATGTLVVASSAAGELIRARDRQCLGIDMETHAVYLAAYESDHKPRYYGAIKAVSDYADADKDDDYHAFCVHLAGGVVRRSIEAMCRELHR